MFNSAVLTAGPGVTVPQSDKNKTNIKKKTVT